MTELLAPAGDIEAGYAALAYGADAVYLGLPNFSARAEATNFTPEALKIFTAYAHSLGKRVLLAVNTVIFNDELGALVDTLTVAEESKVDGVIVQDLGTARLMRKHFPSLRLHGSTQLAVHNREGVEALRDMGFKRVVLARELTLDEIRDICTVQGIEKEVFIHGALCYSYSGLCQFSAVYTGRSANRGKCVYPCRETFCVGNEKKHIFSMKDMAQSENVLLLEKAGVDALKIEGRKKSALYVAAVTDYYRALLNGETNKAVLTQKLNAIKTIFSRPTTSLYLTNSENRRVTDTEIVGHRGLELGKVIKLALYGKDRYLRFKTAHAVSRFDGIQIDLPNDERPFGFSAERIKVNGKDVITAPAKSIVDVLLPAHTQYIPDNATVYLSSATAVKTGYPYTKPKESDFSPTESVMVFVNVTTTEVCASAEGFTATANGEFTTAKSIENTIKSIQDCFAKTGGTGLFLEKIEIESNGLFVPMSVLNDVRRRLYDSVSAGLAVKRQKQNADRKARILNEESSAPKTSQNDVKYIIKTDQPEILKAITPAQWNQIAEVILELPADFKSAIPCDMRKVRFAIPTVLRAKDADWRKLLQKLIAQGARKFEIGNVGALTMLKGFDADITFDWTMYVANTVAAAEALAIGAKRFTVSPESPDAQILFKTFPDQSVAVIYQDIPLFISETCPHASIAQKCVKCGGNRQDMMSSRYGNFVSVMKNCRHYLLNERPHLKKKEADGAKFMRIDFTNRKWKPEQVSDILTKII